MDWFPETPHRLLQLFYAIEKSRRDMNFLEGSSSPTHPAAQGEAHGILNASEVAYGCRNLNGDESTSGP